MKYLFIIAAAAGLAACSSTETLRASDGKEYECRAYVSKVVWWDGCEGSELATKEFRAIKAEE